MGGVSTVDGYSIAMYDIRSLGNAIVAEADMVGEQVRRVRASEVTNADLGGDTGIGASYVGVVHGTLADSLTAFQSAGERLAEVLASTFAHYENADEDGGEFFKRIGGDVR